MFACVLAVVWAAQEPVMVAGSPTNPYLVPFAVAEPVRLALTPKLDGQLGDEEWDPLAQSGTLRSYLQWEPGRLHLAAQAPVGSVVTISLDAKGDGWLVGNDNVEIRIDGITVRARRLDATNVAGPQWIDLPGIGMASKAVTANGLIEATIDDANLGILPDGSTRSVPLRVDLGPATALPSEPYLPRVLTPLTFALRRGAAVPSALRWSTEGEGNPVMPGNAIRIRFTFNGTDALGLTKLAMRSEGAAKEATAQTTTPFPPFDRKGRAFVDYDTRVAIGSPEGWRIVRGTLDTKDGVSSILQASYRIAPIFDLELVRERVPVKKEAQRIRMTYYVRSNTGKRMDGEVEVEVAEPLARVTRADKNFIIYTSRGGVRRVVEFDVPANTRGTYPVKFRVTIGKQVSELTRYLTIG